MTRTPITREELIEGSAMEFVKAALTARGFPTNQWRLLESFPYTVEHFDTNLIAAGFSFDDGGRQAELGSNLKERAYTIEFFVFGKTNTYARNLAHAIKFELEQDYILPLRDVTQNTKPQIDILYLDAVHAHREPIPDPEPFQEFTWITTIKLTDIYDPSLA